MIVGWVGIIVVGHACVVFFCEAWRNVMGMGTTEKAIREDWGRVVGLGRIGGQMKLRNLSTHAFCENV
ncbi:hypothetical protein A1OK_09665 [Enterovibrio norvegicus FF-454]|uniref:Uncharacterized protein n=1 Tax=Enterovibrio norvegicus FF-454 TaxID=1185651 RepID=A0A1E5C7W0_9GAMM|nr:hypothetical protein A1OK_09665 [Enterovibrio norvegicus FF-454]